MIIFWNSSPYLNGKLTVEQGVQVLMGREPKTES